MSKRRIIVFTLALMTLLMGASVSFVSAQEGATPFLGVGYDTNDAGAVITQVVPGSPAAEAGLQSGDVITALNGKPVEAATGLAAAVQSLAVGDTVALTVLRDGETVELSAVLAARPESEFFEAQPFIQQPRPYLGAALEDSDKGIVIREVDANSPAAAAGLQVGDVVKSLNGAAVTTSRELVEAVRALETGDTITLKITRDGEAVTLEATLGSRMTVMLQTPDIDTDGNVLFYDAGGQTWQIVGLSEDSRLYEAGLRPGDVIIAIDGRQYGPAELSDYLASLSEDAVIVLTVERSGQTLDISATREALETLSLFNLSIEMPDIPFGEGELPLTPFGMMMGNGRLGVQFLTLDAQTAADRDLTITEGALITAVEPDSPAAGSGIQTNDIVTTVNSEVVDAERTLRDRLLAYEPGDVVTLDLLRGGETLSVEVTLGEFTISGGGPVIPFFDLMPDEMGRMPFFFDRRGDNVPSPQNEESAPQI